MEIRLYSTSRHFYINITSSLFATETSLVFQGDHLLDFQIGDLTPNQFSVPADLVRVDTRVPSPYLGSLLYASVIGSCWHHILVCRLVT